MRVVVPSPVELVSSTASDIHPIWDSVTSFDANDTVVYDQVIPHKVYKAAQANTNSTPPTNPDDWVEESVSNKYKMLDNFVTSQTSETDTFTATVSVSQAADKIYLLNIEGESVQLTMRSTVPAQVVGSVTIDLRTDGTVSDWLEYFFGEIGYDNQASWNLPGLYRSFEVDITITAATGQPASIGHVIIGQSKYLGGTMWGMKLGIEDYSTKQKNEFGETFLAQGDYSDTLEADVWIDTAPDGGAVDALKKQLASLRAIPCLWDGNNHTGDIATGTDNDAYRVLGFYQDFSIVVQYATVAQCSLQIEGLI